MRRPGAPQDQLERLGVQGVDVEPGRGVEYQDSVRPVGRRREPLERRKPAGGVAPAELVLGAVALVGGVFDDALEQDLLDRPLDRAEREALLEQPVGLLLIERSERAGQAGGGRGSLAALASKGDGGGHVVRLRESEPERLDLGERVLAVTAR